jgi:hypothetical protein
MSQVLKPKLIFYINELTILLNLKKRMNALATLQNELVHAMGNAMDKMGSDFVEKQKEGGAPSLNEQVLEGL